MSAVVAPSHCLAFAGGGNRCWWQAGLVERLKREGWSLPPLLVGTSAGAGVAAALLNEGVDTAIDACERLYARTEHLLDRNAMARLRLRFAHD